jgi:ribosomal protein S19
MIIVPEVHGHVVAVYSGTSFIIRMAQVVVNVTVLQSGSVKVVCQMSA